MLNIADYLRFTDKLLISDACWEWQSPGDQRHYPKFKLAPGKTIDSHRLSYMTLKGAIPEGLYVCHTCDNRRCSNPSHLFLGTAKDNAIDAHQKSRMTPPSTTKLTEFQVAQIRRDLKQGKSHTAIALQYSVSRKTISNIANGYTWKQVA